jgi:hypothetical protein
MTLEVITGGLAILGALDYQSTSYERIVGGLAIDFGRQTPLNEVWGGLGIETTPFFVGNLDIITGGLAILGTPTQTHAGPETITGGLAIFTAIAEIPFVSISTSQPIQASAATGVLPQTGSAIFTLWNPKHMKQTRVQRHQDLHETGGFDFDETRHRWELAINVSAADFPTHWTFIKNHYGSGIPFYFYDLQANGFQYDGTGVLTTGRYLCRFDTDPHVNVLKEGYRYTIEYAVLEVA